MSECDEYEGSNSETDWLRWIDSDMFVYQVYEMNSKIFFIAGILFFEGVNLHFGQTLFPLAHVFHLGGCLRLESSCIWVNMVF
jgi:hypothetical protein